MKFRSLSSVKIALTNSKASCIASQPRRSLGVGNVGLLCFALLACMPSYAVAEFRAGAAVVDVTPVKFPVLVNGGMTSRSADQVNTTVNARALVLDDGGKRVAIIVVDSCMMSREFLDNAKQLASNQTGIPTDRMLISATHTHSAPASMGCLGTDADPEYVPYLRIKIAEAISKAIANLEPAQVGWGSIDANEYTALRRWIRRPDRLAEDPFGNMTVRANMHAGRVPEDVTGESGPEDPELSMIAVQSVDGRPICVLANFSMHYFSDTAISADYFGLFCEGLKKELVKQQPQDAPAFVAIMSHGCSGDIWRRDYHQPEVTTTIDAFSQGLIDKAVTAYEKIEYRKDSDLAMSEARMTLRYRVPDLQRLEWAKRIVKEMGDRLPKDTAEVYAREQVLLYERQATEIVVQALRVGDIAIATTPNETYALTGLKLKHQSPAKHTMVIELANGGDGYIPPPEQHLLGGYNTWAARSAGLEVQAEPKIAEAGIQQLEAVMGTPRKPYQASQGPSSKAILDQKPAAYWRMDEMAGPLAADSTSHHRDGIYEPGVVFFLEGPSSQRFCAEGDINRATHFAGGRMRASLPGVNDQYTVVMRFWNGMPLNARPIAGWLLSHGHDHGLSHGSEHLGLGGTDSTGKLLFTQTDSNGESQMLSGQTTIERWSWHSLIYIRDGKQIRVYLDDKTVPEFEATIEAGSGDSTPWFFGGRTDNQDNWEGRLDEIAVFDRVLTPKDLKTLQEE